jgi:hypothetical protein
MKPLRPPSDFPPVGGTLLLGAVSIVAPWALAMWLGFDTALAWLIFNAGPYGYGILALLYGTSFLIIASAGRAVLLLSGRTARTGSWLLDKIASALAGAVRWMTGRVALAGQIIWLGLRALTRPAEVWLYARFARLREEHALWQRYRSEFYQAYTSFAEFRRAYYGEDDDARAQDTPEPANTLEQAFALFGLAADCGREEFERRYRELIKQVHPDRAGPNAMATQLNEARTLIRKQKGWTS